MNKILVGYTGFVGSNIANSSEFNGLFNSKNIENAYGLEPDLLIYAGVRAEMYLANKYPEKDLENMKEALTNIKLINPKKVVLISTVSVYGESVDGDEDTQINPDNLSPYGRNRRLLEKWVQDEFRDYLIVRLPALFGKGLKKNFIYDYIHIIPTLLTNEKYSELVKYSNLISAFYDDLHNGFFKCKNLSGSEKKMLIEFFKSIGFSALNFTDSRSKYQFYNLQYLYKDIETALQNNIQVFNLATEPIEVGELYKELSGDEFRNEINKDPFNYNVKTKYYKCFGGNNGYICRKDDILADIKYFVENEKKKVEIE